MNAVVGVLARCRRVINDGFAEPASYPHAVREILSSAFLSY